MKEFHKLQIGDIIVTLRNGQPTEAKIVEADLHLKWPNDDWWIDMQLQYPDGRRSILHREFGYNIYEDLEYLRNRQPLRHKGHPAEQWLFSRYPKVKITGSFPRLHYSYPIWVWNRQTMQAEMEWVKIEYIEVATNTFNLDFGGDHCLLDYDNPSSGQLCYGYISKEECEAANQVKFATFAKPAPHLDKITITCTYEVTSDITPDAIDMIKDHIECGHLKPTAIDIKTNPTPNAQV